ncbi:MAG TPA: glutamate synthase central domain-containing protein, partial [Acidimicrobiia bacterium]|nr:glutamate synthase central domain-containing protein [Acidimicrobiia bacterium]
MAEHLGANSLARRDLPPLYDPRFEHDACGVGFVVDILGRASHDIVEQALTAVCCLNHRGAAGAEPDTGDGAGILIQTPDAFYRAVVDFDLPARGAYATGIAFLPPDQVAATKDAIGKVLADEGFAVLGWRTVPVNADTPGASAREVMPAFEQVFVEKDGLRGDELERHVYMARKRIEHQTDAYYPSLSTRVVVYKGMLTPDQVGAFYPELHDERLESALGLVHSRFSTNTFPSWPLAHPFRMLAHNGEINTVQGNENWMRAREGVMQSDVLPGDLERAFPICTPDAADTTRFDEALELLVLAGRPLHHAVLMMIPEAWENHESMDAATKAFYRYHASLMEPWDGPASIAFTDGSVIGAVLDRNGLRPSRYWVTDDDRVIMASEVGVLDVPSDKIVAKGRLEPGKIFLVDTKQGRIIPDEEIKAELAAQNPYQDWLDAGLVHLEDLPPQFPLVPQHHSAVQQQRMFGYTQEDLRLIIAPMARNAIESLGSMGTDTPVPVISDRPRMLYEYFKQLFAQVTNPPLDANFEALVTSLNSTLGPEGNVLDPQPESCHQIVAASPILTNEELAQLRYINDGDYAVPGFTPFTVYCHFPVAFGGDGLRMAIDNVRTQVSEAIAGGANLIILSDRYADAESAPIPALLITAAVHHHLVREKTRTRVGLIVETGEAREVHHFALLLGYGAGAINPYLAFDTIRDLVREGVIGAGITDRKAVKNYVKAAGKGILKVMSKMGISTVASYTGAQIFEAVGLQKELVEEY